MHHIRNTLPDIKTRIQTQLQKFQAELTSLGGPLGDANSGNIVLTIITEFCNEFRTVIDGNSNDLSVSELAGGARISFVFHELFSNGVRAIDPFDTVKDSDIRTILYNSSGSSPALFVGTTAFEVIVKQQIKRLEDPSLKCVSLVYDELVRILAQLLAKNQQFRRFPALRERFNSVVIAFFKRCLQPTTKLVTDIVLAEACYLNTGHPDFISGNKAMAIVTERHTASQPAPPSDPKRHPHAINNEKDLDVNISNQGFFGSFFSGGKASAKERAKHASMEPPPPSLKASGQLTDRESMEVEVIRMLIMSYFNIVKRTIIDMIPKATMLHLVTFAKDSLQRELLKELYQSEVMNELMRESVSNRSVISGKIHVCANLTSPFPSRSSRTTSSQDARSASR